MHSQKIILNTSVYSGSHGLLLSLRSQMLLGLLDQVRVGCLACILGLRVQSEGSHVCMYSGCACSRMGHLTASASGPFCSVLLLLSPGVQHSLPPPHSASVYRLSMPSGEGDEAREMHLGRSPHTHEERDVSGGKRLLLSLQPALPRLCHSEPRDCYEEDGELHEVLEQAHAVEDRSPASRQTRGRHRVVSVWHLCGGMCVSA